jgi:uroporphyrinogen decarboxylase
MTGREIALKAVRNEETPRPAWVPYVGVHGASLIGRKAGEFLKSSDLIVAGMKKAKELYRPDGLPVVFDLQLEAEVLGCQLHWAEDGPPAVVTHPLEGKSDWNANDLPEFDLTKGRIPLVMEAVRKAKAEIGDEVALYGLLCGPFTLALHMLGNDIFLEMFDEEEKVEQLALKCAEVGKAMAAAYMENGCDVIAVVDPMVSQISPEHFAQFVTPAMNEIYDFIQEKGGLSCCFVCGDVTRNLEVMSQTRCDNISVDEQIDMAKFRAIAQAHGKSCGGNLALTVVLLMGTEADAKLNAIRCLDACGGKGFILSPGCDLPYATPPANIAAAGLMALDEYQLDVARKTCQASQADSFDDIVLPDYANESAVILDVITLDSETCAPCQYMKGAADNAAKACGAEVVVREHKITKREGVGHMVKLGVANLPTICIDGEPKFNSIIPDLPTLVKAIEAKAADKAAMARR